MSGLRETLKLACRVILAVGLAGAAMTLILPVIVSRTEWPMGLALALLPAGELAATAIVVTGALRLLISIDERLEQLVDQAGGK